MSDPLKTWDELAAGIRCPFDAPRPDTGEHWDKINSLSVSTLYLHKIQTYRGYCLLIYDGGHATQLGQLGEQEAAAFMSDLRRAARALSSVVRPHHLNVEMLGNVIPHLHWHLIPRYKGDPRWGQPIWTTSENEMLQVFLRNDDRIALLEDLRSALAA